MCACLLHAPWCCRMRLRQWWHFGCPMSMLCSLIMFPIQAPHTLHGLLRYMTCGSSMWRCAQDGESLSIQAWPSHSRWHCRTYIHCIRGGGAVQTHSCREPSDALVQSRTSIFLERLTDDIQQAGYHRIHLCCSCQPASGHNQDTTRHKVFHSLC